MKYLYALTAPALFALFLLVPSRADADLFYWSSEYKAVYDEKVALELQLSSLKSQYSENKSQMEAKIRSLEGKIQELNGTIASLEKRNAENEKLSAARIKELESQIAILRQKGSTREKELLDENAKLNARYSKELKDLRDQMEADRKKNAEDMASMKADYERKIAELQQRISEQNELIAQLKAVSEKQKAELDRMSQQASELEKQLAGEIKMGQIRLKKMFDRIIINLDDKICFNSGSAKLKPDIKAALDKIKKILASYPENKISIEGNTDNIPIRTSEFRDNWQLSTERSLSVLEYLLTGTDLNPSRFTAVGCGENNPIVPNDTPENRALNRRVDIVVVPKVNVK
jgi:chemotaxis protein MotB